jgi:hypothetical protein
MLHLLLIQMVCSSFSKVQRAIPMAEITEKTKNDNER